MPFLSRLLIFLSLIQSTAWAFRDVRDHESPNYQTVYNKGTGSSHSQPPFLDRVIDDFSTTLTDPKTSFWDKVSLSYYQQQLWESQGTTSALQAVGNLASTEVKPLQRIYALNESQIQSQVDSVLESLKNPNLSFLQETALYGRLHSLSNARGNNAMIPVTYGEVALLLPGVLPKVGQLAKLVPLFKAIGKTGKTAKILTLSSFKKPTSLKQIAQRETFFIKYGNENSTPKSLKVIEGGKHTPSTGLKPERDMILENAQWQEKMNSPKVQELMREVQKNLEELRQIDPSFRIPLYPVNQDFGTEIKILSGEGAILHPEKYISASSRNTYPGQLSKVGNQNMVKSDLGAISKIPEGWGLQNPYPLRLTYENKGLTSIKPSQLQLNYQSGREFQNSVHEWLRIYKNKEAYPVFVHGKGYVTTIPDFPLRYGVTEVKNVQYISYTKQLQAQVPLPKSGEPALILLLAPGRRRFLCLFGEKSMLWMEKSLSLILPPKQW